jgi:hypothetical protein
LSAQEQAPTEQDLTLHPGDTITWSPSQPHRVQFGGPGVTAFSEVEKILTDIKPSLTANTQGVATAPAGAVVTATVRDDAATMGVSEFNFTCGFPPHTAQMVTVPFKIAAGGGQQLRDVQIVSANGPLRWVLKSPGDKSLAQP